MELTAKLIRARISNRVFQTRDGILLPNVQISLGEDLKSSTASFSINDPNFEVGAFFREISVKEGGILVPAELLQSPPQTTQQATGVSTTGEAPVTTSLTSHAAGSQKDVVLGIVREALKQGVTDPVKIAFYLAVGEGESNFNHRAHNKELNNPAVTDKRYGGRSLSQITHRFNYQYFGDILKLDLVGNPDLVFRPDVSTYILIAGAKRGWCGKGGLDKWVKGPGSIAAAYRAIQGGVWGSRYQRFFDKWLKEAPALIQQAGGASTPAPTPPPPADPMDGTPATTPPATQEIAPTVEVSNKGTEIIIEVAVGVGVSFKDAVSFHFIHTSTDTSWDASGAQITTFGGKSIRWLLTRVPVTQSFENINLKQYTELQTSGFNLKLEMEGSGLTFQHLSQDGQTALATLFREANRTGFRIAEGTGKKSDTLIVEPFARPQFTNFIIDEEVLIKPVRFTDKARAASSNAPAATVSTPETGTGETKTAIDRATGSLTQTKPESKAGTGQPVGSGGTTGATAPAVGGTVKPDAAAASTTTPAITPSTVASASQEKKTQKVEGPVKVTKEDGTVVVTTITTEQTIEPGKIIRTKTTSTTTTKPNAQPVKVDKVVAVTVTEGKTVTKTTVYEPQKAPAVTTKEEPKVSAEDKKLLEQSKLKSNSEAAPSAGATATADPVTGLPNQQAGFIDLQDGRAEAQVIADESRRVKGYEDDCVLVMNNRTLQLVPGEMVALSKRLFPDVFATEKRIGSVVHDVAAGTTSLQFYTPQAAAPASSGAIAPATPGEVTQFATPALAPGKFSFPVPSGATSIGDGFGSRAGRPPGYKHKILDITAPALTPAIAMADGVVSDIKPNNGSAGNMMVIDYGGGYQSIYMHGAPGFAIVSKGAQVKQGQPVFKIGTTGRSTGNHLHLSFNLNGSYCLLSKVGIDVLKMGLPVHRFNPGCNQY